MRRRFKNQQPDHWDPAADKCELMADAKVSTVVKPDTYGFGVVPRTNLVVL